MKQGLKGFVVAAVLGMTLAAAPPAGAATQPELLALPFVTTPGQVADTEIFLTFPDQGAATAKTTIFVPHGYTTNLNQPAGTKIADVMAQILVGGTKLPLTGQVIVDEPGKYVSDARAQACAPGRHANVWLILATLGTTTIPIPMFVDPIDNQTLGTYQIQTCLTPPDVPEAQGGAPMGARLIEADLDFGSTFTNPPTVDIGIWRALVTPFLPGTVNANPSGTVEIRSIAFFPFTVSLKARYDAKHRQVILTGKVRLASLTPAGIPIGILSLASPTATPKLFGQTKTKKGGAFTLKKKLAKTTFLVAIVPPDASDSCVSGPPVTAAPCVHETTSLGLGRLVRVVVKKKR